MSVGWLEQQRNEAKQKVQGKLNSVLLPQNEKDLAEFVNHVTSEYSLPSGEKTELTIYQVIYNMPNGKAFVDPEEVANQVRKSIANDVVGKKLNAYQIKLKEQARRSAEEQAAKKQEETKTQGSSNGSEITQA